MFVSIVIIKWIIDRIFGREIGFFVYGWWEWVVVGEDWCSVGGFWKSKIIIRFVMVVLFWVFIIIEERLLEG